MRTDKRLISLFCVVLAVALVSQPAVSNAQIFGSGELTNSVDLDLLAIIQCQLPEGTDELLEFIICNLLLPDLIDQLVEAEAFLDQVFAGYRNDIPFFLRRQLDEPLRIQVVFDAIDGPGMVLATAGPTSFANLVPNPFLRTGVLRAWSIPRTATITLDVDDVVDLVLTEVMVDVAVHEAFHAMGHPSAFLISRLNGPTNIFGQINFLGDDHGINEAGFGLLEFRGESGNPFAQFIPLSQSDSAAHLSAFEPAFNQPASGLQEVFIPTAPPPGTQAFMSRSLQGMFADLGYKVRGVNAFGFVDIDQDGIEDDPLIINPIPPGEPGP